MPGTIPNKYNVISVDITGNCNLRCPFCVNDFSNIHGNIFMSQEIFEKSLTLLPLIRKGGVFRISSIFEPSIHPRFIELIRSIPATSDVNIYYTTNLARPMSDEFFHELSNSNITFINISLDSFIPEVFETLRRGARHKNFIDNLERMVAIFSKHPNPPGLRYITVLSKANLSEVSSLIKTTKEKYLAEQHEFRSFWLRQGQDEEWVKENDISWSDLLEVEKVLKNQPYKYFFRPFENPEDFLEKSTDNQYEQIVYSQPSPLELSIFSDGKVILERTPVDVEFSLKELNQPHPFFENILRLHALDIERAKELSRIRQETSNYKYLQLDNETQLSKLEKRSEETRYWIDSLNINETKQTGDRNNPKTINIGGWAVDSIAENLAFGVNVVIDNKIFNAFYGLARDDVAIALKSYIYRNSGFSTNIPVSEIGPGTHHLSLVILTLNKKSYYVTKKIQFEVQ